MIPEKDVYQLPYGTEMHEAFSHALELAVAANGEGLAIFSSYKLGVCWVATAPK